MANYLELLLFSLMTGISLHTLLERERTLIDVRTYRMYFSKLFNNAAIFLYGTLRYNVGYGTITP